MSFEKIHESPQDILRPSFLFVWYIKIDDSELKKITKFKIPKLKNGRESRHPSRHHKQTSKELRTNYVPLKMMKLHAYNVPGEIEMIEYYDNISEFSKWEDMAANAMKDETVYYNLCTAMIHLEECANAKPQRQFNQNAIYVKQQPSAQGNMFKIEYDVCMKTKSPSSSYFVL